MGLVRKAVVAGIIGILVYKIISIVNLLDLTKAAYNLEPGKCRLVKGVEFGSEDVQALPNGLAFVSSGVKFAGFENSKHAVNIRGQIFLFDFNKPADDVVALKIEGEALDKVLFNPHGISLWQGDSKDSVTLFVINHLPNEDTVEKFTFGFKTKVLKHIKTISSPNFRSLNDVVAVSDDAFYVTNMFHYRSMFEFLTLLHWGSLTYWDGKEGRYVASGLFVPNGFARKDNHLYVAALGEKAVYVYTIEKDHSLTLAQRVWVGSACDNVDVSVTTGDVLFGCHPVLHTLYLGGYMDDPQHGKAPSQILRMKTTASGLLDTDGGINLVYADNGDKFSASSVGVHYKKQLLIGSIYTKLLYCDLAI